MVMNALLWIALALCALIALAIFRKRRFKANFESWVGKFSFEAEDDVRPDAQPSSPKAGSLPDPRGAPNQG
jgi:hypothetical protein